MVRRWTMAWPVHRVRASHNLRYAALAASLACIMHLSTTRQYQDASATPAKTARAADS